MPQVLAIAGTVTVMLAALGALGAALAWAWRVLRSIARLADDLLGEPARGMQPGRPGIVDRFDRMEQLVTERMDAMGDEIRDIKVRLAAVEYQLRPNGGGSLRDQVDHLVSTKDMAA